MKKLKEIQKHNEKMEKLVKKVDGFIAEFQEN